MTKKIRNWSIVAGIVAFPFILFFAFLFSRVTEPLPSPLPLPKQNGYDDFVKAGQMLAPFTGNYDPSNLRQLQTIVEGNSNALQLARTGLGNECRVPVQFSESYVSNHLGDLAALKRVAQAFVAEGKLAETKDRPNDAAKSYLDTIRFGNEAMRGGVLIDALVGIAIENMGTSHLTNLVAQLDANSCRKTATSLETLDSQRPTWNEIMQQEKIWRKAFEQLQKVPVSKMPMMDRMAAKTDQTCELKFNTQEQKMRRAMIDFATRAYQLDKGKPPMSISDLVPNYLKTIPQDTFTGTNMVYLSK